MQDEYLVGRGFENLAWTPFNYVFYADGIARYPTLFSVYSSIYVGGFFTIVIASLVVGILSGLEGSATSGPTSFQVVAFLLALSLPLVPVAYLEARRRRRGGTKTIEKAVASGQAKLIPWDEVARVELRPILAGSIRPGFGGWVAMVVTPKKQYKVYRLSPREQVEDFLRNKVGEKLWVYERQAGRSVRVRYVVPLRRVTKSKARPSLLVPRKALP